MSLGDFAIAFAVSVLGLANLALPESTQQVLGVDYLVLALAVLTVLLLVRLSISARRPVSWVIALVISLCALPGFVGTEIGAYATQKLQTIVIIAICLVAVASMRVPERGARVFLACGAGLSVLFSLFLLTVSTTADNGRVSVFGLNPVGVARLTALGCVLFLVYVISTRGLHVLRITFFLVLVALAGTATFITGSRGPLVAAAGAVMIALLVALSIRGANVAIVLSLGVVIVVSFNLGNLSLDESLSLSTGRQDSGRFVLYADALGRMLTDPFGIGWGNFGQLYGLSSGVMYPHNIFLEIGVEGGFFALLGFGVAMVLAFVWSLMSYRRSRSRTDLLLLATYTYALCNAQFSSDLVGNRMLWIAMAFVIAIRAADPKRRSPLRHGLSGRSATTISP